MIEVAGITELITALTLNIIVIVGLLYKSAKDKTTLENRVASSEKEIRELKLEQKGGFKDLIAEVKQTNTLLQDFKSDMRAFELKITWHDDEIRTLKQDLDATKEQLRGS